MSEAAMSGLPCIGQVLQDYSIRKVCAVLVHPALAFLNYADAHHGKSELLVMLHCSVARGEPEPSDSGRVSHCDPHATQAVKEDVARLEVIVNNSPALLIEIS